MFVSDRLIYLQMRKTACTHIAHLLAECIGGKEVGYKHNPLPTDYPIAERLIIGSIRNPWDYYVSSWAYGIKNQEDGLYKRVTTRNFGRYLRNPHLWSRAPRGLFNMATKPVARWEATYADFDDAILFRNWLKMIYTPRRKYDMGESYGFSSVANFVGLMTFRYAKLFWRDNRPLFNNTIHSLTDFCRGDSELNLLQYVIRTESLETDFITALQKVGYTLTAFQIEQIQQAKRTNVSSHQAACYYYDADTLALIAEKERFLIEAYRYEPPTLLS